MIFASARRGPLAAALALALAAAACSSSKETPPALQRLDLTPPAPSLPRGAALQLRATALWTTGAPQDVGPVATWTTSNGAVATVAGGLVTGVAQGSATITATWSGQTAAVAVTVTPAALLAIAVDPPAAALPAGTRRAFTATGTYSDGSTADLTAAAGWAASPAGVAAMPAGAAPGEVEAVAEGAATVTASHQGKEAAAAVTVTAPALVELRVAPPAATSPAGLATAFTATGVYSDGSTADLTAEVLWAAAGDLAVFPSGAPAGTARALAVGGPVVIHALLPGSVAAGQATLTITDAVPVSLDVSPGAATLAAGLTRAFTASAVFSDGHHADVTSQAAWSSSAPAVADVSTAPATAGQVSARAAGGPVTITASLPGTAVGGTATLTVAAAAVAGIDLSPATATVAAGRTQAFTAEAVLTDGRRLPATDDATWSSSDPGLAPVSNAAGTRGVATGLRAGGPVTVTARLPGEAAVGAAALTVAPAALTGLVVEPAALSLAAGTGGRLVATGLFSDGTRADLTGVVTWTSATPAAVAVATGGAGAGVVSALQAGGPVAVTAAMPGGGPEATAAVTVTPAVLVSLALTPPGASVALGRSAAFQATGTFSDGRRQDLTAQVSWLSSDAAVATVSNAVASAGVAQSRGEGTAELVAWFPGTAVTAAATFTVTPPEVLSIAVAPASVTIPAGRLQRFTAAGTYTDGVVRDVTAAAAWASSAPGTAAVTAVQGELRGVAAGGPVAVTATLAGVSGAAALTVGPAVLDAIAVAPPDASLRFGESVDLTATGTYSDGAVRDVTAAAAWDSAPSGLVRLQPVAGAVRATGRALGAAVVTATLDGVSGEAGVTVAPVLPVQVVVLPGAARAGLGQLLQLRAFGTFADGAVVEVTGAATWSASDPLVLAAAAQPGQFEALQAGHATVTATLGAAGSASVEVVAQPFSPALAALRVDGAEAPLGVGGLAQLRALGLLEDGQPVDVTTEVAWSTGDAGVATVDSAGLARGVALGATAVQAAHAASGLSATATLTVAADAVPATFTVRVAPRVPAGAVVQALAIGRDAAGAEVDLTAAVAWFGLGGARDLGAGRFTFTAPGGRVAAVWGDQLALADVTALGPEAASAYRILPGDATLAPAQPGLVEFGLDGLATFVAVLSFEDAEPAEVVAGACTDDGPQALDCAFNFLMGGPLDGCELACFGGQGASVCLPTAPTTRTITCTAGGRVATATATVTGAPHVRAAAGLLLRPAGWSSQPLFSQEGDLTKDFQGQPLPTLHPGEVAALEAVAVWDDATFLPTPAAWSSGDPRVATVEAPGRLRAGAAGGTVVQATALSFTASAALTVAPAGQAGSALVVQGPARLQVGQEAAAYQALGTGVVDVTGQVVWRSSDPSVAEFDPAAPGLLLPVGPGVTTVTATSRQGFSSSLEVTVVGVVGLELYPTQAVVGLGQPFNPIALVRSSDGTLAPPQQPLAWWVEDPNVLFPDFELGAFVGASLGATVLHVELPPFGVALPVLVADQGSTDLDSVVVFPVPPLAVGEVGRPDAFAVRRDASFLPVDASYAFASADPAVAAPVAGDPGALVGVGAGATTWTVTAPGGAVSGSTPVTVYQLASIVLSPATSTLAVGQVTEFQVTGVDTTGQRHALPAATVTSSDPVVAAPVPGAPAMVQALAEGTATITAAFGGLTGSATVTVGPAQPVGLRFAPGTLFVELGTRAQVRVLAALTDGTELDVTAQAALRTLDAAVVALPAGEPTGTVEAVGLGRGALYAAFAANGRSVSAVGPVQVIPVITQLIVEAFPQDVPAGETVEVFAGAFLQDGGVMDLTGSVTFTSGDLAILEPRPAIAPNVFAALAPGVATVTGALASGASGTTEVFVGPPQPVALEITPAVAAGVVGQTSSFTALATMTDGSVRDLTDAASWEAIGPADQVGPGVFRPFAGGTIEVRAFVFGGRGEAFAFATLEVPHVLVSLSPQLVSGGGAGAFQGEPAAFRASGQLDDGTQVDATADVVWTVDRPDATLGPAPGDITFLGTGLYVVTVTAPGGTAVGELFLEVRPVPLSLTVSPDPATVEHGSYVAFSAQVAFSDGSIQLVGALPETSWVALNEIVAPLVSFDGTFYGQTPGTTVVFATYADGVHVVEGWATLTVVAVPLASPRVEPFLQSIVVGQVAQFQLLQAMSDGSDLDLTAASTWTVDEGSLVARSDGAGAFTGLAMGGVGVWARPPGSPTAYPGVLDVFP